MSAAEDRTVDGEATDSKEKTIDYDSLNKTVEEQRSIASQV